MKSLQLQGQIWAESNYVLVASNMQHKKDDYYFRETNCFESERGTSCRYYRLTKITDGPSRDQDALTNTDTHLLN